MSRFPYLFAPISVGNVQIKNRIAMAPMTNGYCDADGNVTDRLIAYHEARARGGVGLIIMEAAAVHLDGRGWGSQPGCYDDRFIPGLVRLAEGIHAGGGRAFMQLMHAGGSARSTLIGKQALAASPIVNPRNGELPKELTLEEIGEITEAFAQAARRAKTAGFDGVELHGANGYLINEFLSPLTNVRTDEYGGDARRRTLFAANIIKRIREVAGPDFTVTIRVSADEFDDGGITIEESKVIGPLLEQAGFAAIHISGGRAGTTPKVPFTTGVGEATLMHLAAGLKQVVSIPVIVVGRILSPEIADAAIQEGKTDMVAIGRALIADPDLPNKFKEGRLSEVIPCQGCNGCQIRSVGGGITCLLNTRSGRELGYNYEPARERRKLLVLGGGLAGLEAARVAALRGHSASVHTLGQPIGGLQTLRQRVPHMAELQKSADYYRGVLSGLGVEISEAPAQANEVLASRKPDVLVETRAGEAIGCPDNLEGSDLPCLTAEDVLSGRAVLDGVGEAVAVLGVGLLAGELALYLGARGKKVTLVGEAADAFRDTHPEVAFRLNVYLSEFPHTILTNTKVLGATGRTLRVSDGEGERNIGPFGAIVSAGGWNPVRTELQNELADLPAHFIGDAYDAYTLTSLTSRAFEVGHEI